MKRFLLSFLFLSAAVARAFALNPPTSSQLQGLQIKLQAIQSLQASIVGLTQLIEAEKATIDPQNKQIVIWERLLKSQKAQLAPLCRTLMNETRGAYRIKPTRYSAEIVLAGSLEGTRANWQPKFGEMKSERTALNRAGHVIAMAEVQPYVAITWENGDIIITIDAFKFSPGYLAAIISHETIHFDQITTRDRGDKTSPQQREREAFNVARGLIYKTAFNLSPAELAVVEETFNNSMKATSFSRNGTVIGASGFESVDLTADTNGKDLLHQKIQEALKIADENRARAEGARQRDHDERLKSLWIVLAQRTCDNPGSVSQSELDALPRLHNNEPLDVVMLFGKCYDRVYYRLYTGESAEAIAREARPAGVAEPPRPLPPVADAIAERTFGSVFPNLQFFAEMACKYKGQIPTPSNGVLTPRGGYTLKHGDDETVARIAAGLGRCEGHVFRSLYEMLREGRGNQITKEWFIGTVARTPAPPSNPPPDDGQVSPPVGGGYVAPPKGTNPCQRGDDPFGCQPRQ